MRTANIAGDLKKNSAEFLQSAEASLAAGLNNAAVDSYFKSAATLCDAKIYEKMRVIPDNHTERFSILKARFPEAYRLLSSLFSTYRQSYNERMSKEDAGRVKKGVLEVRRILGP